MANRKYGGGKPQLNNEKVRFCDTYTDGAGEEVKKEFLRCFVYKNGVLDVSKTKDYELDGLTIYTPQGEVTRCIEDVPDQCDLMDVWICDASTGVPGVTEQIWYDSAVGGVRSSEPIDVGFTLVDECGLPAHENAPDTTQVLTTYDSTNINIDPPDNTPDQHILESYVKLPENVTLGLRSGGIHAGLLALGTCNGKLKESLRYENSLAITSVGFAGPGFVHVKSFIHDPTQNGNHRLQYSSNGGQNWSDVPADWLYTTIPTVQQTKAYYNKTECKWYRYDTKEEIDTTGDIDVLCYNPCKPEIEVVVQEPLDVIVKKDLFKNLGSESIKYDDTTAGKLTIPTGATYATIQFQGECETIFNLDGTNPVNGGSKIALPCDELELGCSKHFIGDVADLENFVALAGEEGCTNVMQVCYYGEA